MSLSKFCVVFVCRDNSCRSVIAQHLLHSLCPDRFTALSAGWEPAESISPHTREALSTAGICADIDAPRPLTAIPADTHVDLLIILRGADEGVPLLNVSGTPIIGTWTAPEPRPIPGRPVETAAIFADTVRTLRRAIDIMVELPDAALSRLSQLTGI